jgi:hypothetical protein
MVLRLTSRTRAIAGGTQRHGRSTPLLTRVAPDTYVVSMKRRASLRVRDQF